MADKYLKSNGATLLEVEAATSSAGAGDAGKIIALDSAGKINNNMMPSGIGPDTSAVASSENLAAGDLVNIYNDAGTAKCRKADATAVGKAADGFVLAVVTSPADATVYFEGTNAQVTGLTPGEQFLATTAGGMTTTPPSASGNAVQSVGIATSATSMNFERSKPTILA